MALISKSRLGALCNLRMTITRQVSQFNESVDSSKAKGRVGIFLSHSHDDLEKPDVQQAIALLTSEGVSIYVDSRDPGMPPYTNAATANRIRSKIANHKLFLLFATNKAIVSRWCNWELGIGDVRKYAEHIAIFPLTEDRGDWQGNEYLQIYPYIEEPTDARGTLAVRFPDGQTMPLKQWLSPNRP